MDCAATFVGFRGYLRSCGPTESVGVYQTKKEFIFFRSTADSIKYFKIIGKRPEFHFRFSTIQHQKDIHVLDDSKKQQHRFHY
jgi:hypothetical protein